MPDIALLAALTLAGQAFAPLVATAPLPAVTTASAADGDGAACAYEGLSPADRENVLARTFERMMRGADEEADAPSRARIDDAIAGAQASCGRRHGWSAELSGLSHEFATLALARDAFRRMLDARGMSSAFLDAYHGAHRGEFGRAITAPQQAAFAAAPETRQWAAADRSGGAIQVAIGYLGVVNELERCQRSFAVALAQSRDRPIETAAR